MSRTQKKTIIISTAILVIMAISFIGYPSDYGKLLQTSQTGEVYVSESTIDLVLADLEKSPQEIDIETVLEDLAKHQVLQAEEVLSYLSASPENSSVELFVRLLDQNLLDRQIAQEYLTDLNSYQYTGLEIFGYKFLQKNLPANSQDQWLNLPREADNFSNLAQAGEVIVIDEVGTISRLLPNFSIEDLKVPDRIEAILVSEEATFKGLNFAGDSLAQALSLEDAEDSLILTSQGQKEYQISLADNHNGFVKNQYFLALGWKLTDPETARESFQISLILPVSILGGRETDFSKEQYSGISNAESEPSVVQKCERILINIQKSKNTRNAAMVMAQVAEEDRNTPALHQWLRELEKLNFNLLQMEESFVKCRQTLSTDN